MYIGQFALRKKYVASFEGRTSLSHRKRSAIRISVIGRQVFEIMVQAWGIDVTVGRTIIGHSMCRLSKRINKV